MWPPDVMWVRNSHSSAYLLFGYEWLPPPSLVATVPGIGVTLVCMSMLILVLPCVRGRTENLLTLPMCVI